MYIFKNIATSILYFFFFSLISLSSLQSKSFNISIIQTVEHPALNATRDGLLDEFKKLGYQDLQVDYQSAQGNTALAAQIGQKFASSHPDVIVAIGTTAAQAVMSATKGMKIPIVFSSVTDPISAKLVKDLEVPEGFVTGVSNFIPVEPEFELFKRLHPNLKTLGVVYNPGEANSVELLKVMEEVAKNQGISIVAASASKTSEVMSAAQSLCGKADAVFVNNDNTALAAFKSVAKAAQSCGIPAFVSDVDLVDQGALAALGPNQTELGRQTARMVARILENPGAQLPAVEFPEKTEEVINKP